MSRDLSGLKGKSSLSSSIQTRRNRQAKAKEVKIKTKVGVEANSKGQTDEYYQRLLDDELAIRANERDDRYHRILQDEIKIRENQALQSKEREFPHVVQEVINANFPYITLKNLRLVSKTTKDEADREIKRRYKVLTGENPLNIVQAMKLFELSSTYRILLNDYGYGYREEENYIKDYEYSLQQAFAARSLGEYLMTEEGYSKFRDIIESYTKQNISQPITAPWLNNVKKFSLVKRNKTYFTKITKKALEALFKLFTDRPPYVKLFIYQLMVVLICEDSTTGENKRLLTSARDKILEFIEFIAEIGENEYLNTSRAKLDELIANIP